MIGFRFFVFCICYSKFDSISFDYVNPFPTLRRAEREAGEASRMAAAAVEKKRQAKLRRKRDRERRQREAVEKERQDKEMARIAR